jgi:hypothetical protein
MSRICFANKGITRAHKCHNLWPVTGKLFNRTPKEFFFQEPGLIAYINPKVMKSIYFVGEIYIYDPRRARYVTNDYWHDDTEFLQLNGCVLTAVYNKGLYINSTIRDMATKSPGEVDSAWRDLEDALHLLYLAAETYKEYFIQPYTTQHDTAETV